MRFLLPILWAIFYFTASATAQSQAIHYFQMGDSLLRTADFRESAASYKLAAKQYGEEGDWNGHCLSRCRMWLTRYYRKPADLQLADSELQAAGEESQQRLAKQKNATYLYSLLARGWLRKARGLYSEAEGFYRKALRLAPAYPATPTATLAKLKSSLGEIVAYNGQKDSAWLLMEEARTLAYASEDTATILRILNERMGFHSTYNQQAEAVAVAEERAGLQRRPSWKSPMKSIQYTYVTLANAHFQRQDLAGAERQIYRMMAIAAKDSSKYWESLCTGQHLLYYYNTNNNWKHSAAAHADTSLAIAERFAPPEGHFFLSECYLTQGKKYLLLEQTAQAAHWYERAEDAAERYARSALEQASIYENYGLFLAYINQKAAARKKYRKAIEILAKDGHAPSRQLQDLNYLTSNFELPQEKEEAIPTIKSGMSICSQMQNEQEKLSCQSAIYAQLGNTYYSIGSLDALNEAKKEFLKAVDVLRPLPPSRQLLNSLLQLSNTFIQLDSIGQAEKHLSKAEMYLPQLPNILYDYNTQAMVHYQRGQLLWKTTSLKQIRQGVKAMEKSLQNLHWLSYPIPLELDVLSSLTSMHIQLQEWDKALRYSGQMEAFINKNPFTNDFHRVDLYIKRANIFLNQKVEGSLEKAREAYRQAMAVTQQAPRSQRRVQAWLNIVETAFIAVDREAARECIAHAEHDMQQLEEGRPFLQYMLHFNKGRLHQMEGGPAALQMAIEEYRKAIPLTRQFPVPDMATSLYINLKDIYVLLQEYEKAIVLINEAQENIEKSKLAKEDHLRGLLCLNKGNIYGAWNIAHSQDSAIFYFKKAIHHYQNTPYTDQAALAHAQLGMVYKDKGELNKARSALGKAEELLSKMDFVPPQLRLATSVIKGDLAFQNGDVQRAEAEYKKAVAEAKDLQLPIQELGNYYYKLTSIYVAMQRIDEAFYFVGQMEEVNQQKYKGLPAYHAFTRNLRGNVLINSDRPRKEVLQYLTETQEYILANQLPDYLFQASQVNISNFLAQSSEFRDFIDINLEYLDKYGAELSSYQRNHFYNQLAEGYNGLGIIDSMFYYARLGREEALKAPLAGAGLISWLYMANAEAYRSNFKMAEQYLEEILERAESVRSERTAYLLSIYSRVVQAAYQAQLYELAQRSLQEGMAWAEELGYPPLEYSNLLLASAYPLSYQLKYDAALSNLQKALEIINSLGREESTMAAYIYYHMAGLYQIWGEPGKATEAVDKYLYLLEKGYGAGHANGLAGLALRYSLTNDFIIPDQEIEEMELMNARIIEHYGPDYPQLASHYQQLGISYYNLAVLPEYNTQPEKFSALLQKSTIYFEKGLAISEKKFGKGALTTLVLLSRLSINSNTLGNYEDAEAYLAIAEARAADSNNGLMQFEFISTRIMNYFNRKEYQKAITTFKRQESELLQKIEQSPGTADHLTLKYLMEILYNRLAQCYISTQEPELALEAYHKALHFLLGKPFHTGLRYEDIPSNANREQLFRALNGISSIIVSPTYQESILQDEQQLNEALTAYRQLNGDPGESQMVSVNDGLPGAPVDTLLAIGFHTAQANLPLTRWIYQLRQDMRDRISDEQARAAFAEQTLISIQAYTHTLAWMWGYTNEKQYLREAFNVMERNRAEVLREIIAESEQKAIQGIPDSLLARERALQQERFELNRSGLQYISPEVYRIQASTIEAQLGALKRKINQEYPRYEELYPEGRYTPGLLQSWLPEGTLLVTYSLPNPLHYNSNNRETALDTAAFVPQGQAFAMTRNELATFMVQADAEFYTNLKRVKNSISPNNTYREAARSLQQSLLPDWMMEFIEKREGAIKHLIIIPDAELANLSFEALLTADSPADMPFSELPYLIRNYRVSYAYSTALLQRQFLNEKITAQYEDGSLLAAAPVYDMPDSRELPLQQTESLLNKLGKYARRSKAYFSPLLREQANKKNLKQALAAKPFYNYLLLAAHGYIDDESPATSHIALAPAEGEKNALFVGDIYNMTMKAGLAVLLGCETNQGAINRSEGIIGFTRALLFAGCNNVLVSQQRVKEKATVTFAEALFQKLYKAKVKEPVSSVLQEVKLEMIRGEYGEELANPYYWAPFILVGQ